MLLQRISDGRFADNSLSNFWRSLSELDAARHNLNRLLTGDSAAGTSSEFPALNVWLSEDEALVEAELAGIEAEDIDISVTNDSLTLRGSRPAYALAEGERFHRQERGSGQFSRSLQLPFRIDADNVEANLSKGVLQIRVPRAESDKLKKIMVRPA